MAAQKPTNSWLQFSHILLGLGAIALIWNLVQTTRTYFDSDASGFDFGLFMQVFTYTGGSPLMMFMVWAPLVLLPAGLVVWLIGRSKPRERYRDGTPVTGVEPGSGTQNQPGTEFSQGTGVNPANPNAFGTAESHTDRSNDEPR